jgi:chromosome segregation ATPase
VQTQLLQHVASVSTLQQQLAGVNEEIEGLTECMEDSNVKLNDKDQEIQRLGQALDTATQLKQEMQVLLMEMDSEITSLKAQLQANGVPAAGHVVPRTRVSAAQVILLTLYSYYYCYHSNIFF